MKYHIISTSKTGHGAIFTNLKAAEKYQKEHPGSSYFVSERIPARIPPIKKTGEKSALPDVNKTVSKGVTIYTDGSALGNPGPGGYGVVMIIDGNISEASQGYRHTTNNRMEMMAVITALNCLEDHKRPVKIYSDSQYTLNGITKGWARNWQKKGWKKSDGKPAKNIDLWKQILDLVDQFQDLTFEWVRGHAGDPMNERADELANNAARETGRIEDIGYDR